jgi:hypothetical protein
LSVTKLRPGEVITTRAAVMGSVFGVCGMEYWL